MTTFNATAIQERLFYDIECKRKHETSKKLVDYGESSRSIEERFNEHNVDTTLKD